MKNQVRASEFNPIFRIIRESEAKERKALLVRIANLLRAIDTEETKLLSEHPPNVQDLTEAWLLLGDATLLLECVQKNLESNHG